MSDSVKWGGGALSPHIFNIMVDVVVRQWTRGGIGDNISAEGLQKMIEVHGGVIRQRWHQSESMSRGSQKILGPTHLSV